MDNDFGASLKFYADWSGEPSARTGLNVQHVASRAGSLTLNLELAPILEARQSPDWQQKTTLQLSPSELVDVCAVLLGYRRTTKGAYHGPARNKGFQAHSNPAKGAMIALSEQGRILKHLLNQSDRACLAAFVLNRVAESWGMNAQAALMVLERTETLPRV